MKRLINQVALGLVLTTTLQASPVAAAEPVAAATALSQPATDPSTCRASLSNGVAIGPDLAWATERARLELIERDRVLRAWYGELEPEALALPGEPPASETYAWRAATFPTDDEPEHVVGVFGFPLRDEAPLLRGFAARTTEGPSMAIAYTRRAWREPSRTPLCLGCRRPARSTSSWACRWV